MNYSFSGTPGKRPLDEDDSNLTREERRKKRKSRWNTDNEDRTVIPGMPAVLPSNMSVEQQRQYIVHLQIEEISRKLRTGDLGIPPLPELRSPSPEPIYNNEGKRLNTREYRTRKKLEEERHKLVTEAIELNAEYKPPMDYKPLIVRVNDKVMIPQDDHPDINFVGLLIGPRGNTLKTLEKDTGAKIIIRGKGSVKEGKIGRKDGQPLPGEDEPLHAYVTGNNPECVKKAVEKIKTIIAQGIDVPEGQNDLRRQQLRELALLNGTLRENDGLAKLKQLQAAQNIITNTILCTCCGGTGHIAQDCKQKRPGDTFRSLQLQQQGGQNSPMPIVSQADKAKMDSEYMSLMAELGEGPPPSSKPPGSNLTVRPTLHQQTERQNNRQFQSPQNPMANNPPWQQNQNNNRNQGGPPRFTGTPQPLMNQHIAPPPNLQQMQMSRNNMNPPPPPLMGNNNQQSVPPWQQSPMGMQNNNQMMAIAQCRREEQDTIIKSARYISVISDGSTDVSSTEAEVVYLKTSHNCQVNTYFIGLKNVPKADSLHISQGISSLLTKRFGDRWMGKLVAMGTDGAAVMIGKSSGVVKKIAEETQRPFVRAIHCSAHRLELAAKDAGKEVNIAKKCDLLLLNLYLFYRYSPLNRSNLKIAFKSKDQKVRIPTRVGGTRWLPHTEKALKNLLLSYDAIVCHLEQMQVTPSDFRKESSAKGRWFLKLLKDKSVVKWLHFMMDVIKCLSRVSTTIQTRESTLADIFNELESAKLILNKYLTSDGPFLRKVADEDDPMSQIQKTKYLDKLIKSLSDRFEGDLELFQSSTVLSIDKWPEDFKKDIDFGDDKIEDLVKISAPALTSNEDVDITEIESEWTRLKTIISNRKQPKSNITWASLYQTDGPSCPNLFAMVDYMLTLPGSSVDAERGFSCMKLVKSDWRSRLGEDNLSDLMLISMEVDPIATYNPLPAIEKWYTGGLRARRPFYKDDLVKNTRVPTDKICIEEGQIKDIPENEEQQTVTGGPPPPPPNMISAPPPPPPATQPQNTMSNMPWLQNQVSGVPPPPPPGNNNNRWGAQVAPPPPPPSSMPPWQQNAVQNNMGAPQPPPTSQMGFNPVPPPPPPNTYGNMPNMNPMMVAPPPPPPPN